MVNGSSPRNMPDRTNDERPASDSVGHVSVHLGHLHPQEISFSFENQRSRMSGAMGFSFAFHGVAIASFLFLATWLPTLATPIDLRGADDRGNLDQIVWIAEPGPGGGGGGGGNESIEPPRLAELPGQEKLTVPVLKPPVVTPAPAPEDVLPKQEFNIPAQTLASAETTLTGVLEGMRSSNSPTAQGPGRGGGAGTGTGTGIGPGSGSGLGPGWGGGTGGNAYRPGAGIELPRLLQEVKPQYTADAMRAKIQGTAILDCVVTPEGTVRECEVVRSLDASFGLDQEAVKAARQWRFTPGRRLGQPVPVLVTIEMLFALR